MTARPADYMPIAAPPPLDAAHRDRRFFTGTTIALILTFVAGFSWSTYVRTRPGATAFGGPTLLPLVRWHAGITTSWMLFLLLQTSLVATHRTKAHRQLGVFGGLLALAVVISGWLVAFQLRPLTMVRSPTFFPAPGAFEFTILPGEELFVFTLLIGLGLYFRRTPAAHKRLMLLGTLALIPAGTTRLPLPPPLLLLAFFAVPEAIVVGVLMWHDLVTRRRIHNATIWGGALVIFGAASRLWIAHTDSWFVVAGWLSR
jgi:uncharacterized membrane protein YozB (DUF420 family)